MIITMGCSPWNRNGVVAGWGERVVGIVVAIIGMADIDVLRKESVIKIGETAQPDD